ncbi:uncharacterized protein LOC120701127 [Panicum virgatum]|uniref:uncharacterized protein LOC120701127 n=1 Tax=Panicum virgatum TaxID=38727 RepID=UPI0019D5E411|nr:uncharacterized protein LOC120701127 [Panicum virgatum]
MGNNMGRHQLYSVINATSRSFSHELRDLWNSPRGTVLRIETIALVAMVLSFFLAAFGSCCRWSNSWFIQKGFLAANALFLSLGTYCIGLMQSSQVKSEMYPLWAVSLMALLCCVDSAAGSSLDSRSQLWKMLYQLCLYFGYVLLMSISTITSDVGNIAICLLAAVTFFKGFHRSMALVLPSSMRNMIASMRFQDSRLNACKDMCVSLSLSHLLHRRFLGLNSAQPTMDNREPLVKNYERALKLVETELAFLYDVLYTSNAFLHYYEARSASIWAFASLIGICFVGTTVAVIPRSRATPRHASSPGNTFVDTTVADFVITGVILASLALLQVLQLLRCWTSNWAKVSFARDCKRIFRHRNDVPVIENEDLIIKNEDLGWGMRLRASLIKIDWSDKYQYLWQNKLGQHSLMESITSQRRMLPGRSDNTKKLYVGVRDVAIWSVKSTATGDNKLQALESFDPFKYCDYCEHKYGMYSAEYGVLMGSSTIYGAGVVLGKVLRSMPAADRWEMLAEFWVKALLYAAPSDMVEEHMQHLSQGGELITHLWALLYHTGVHRWHLDPSSSGWGGTTSSGSAHGKTSIHLLRYAAAYSYIVHNTN